MDVTNKSKVAKSLKNNEIDFALVSILPNDIAVESISLMENKLFLVGNKSIEINAKRFEMSDQLAEIFTNTAKRLKY